MSSEIETIINYIARSEGYDDGPALDALRQVRQKLLERGQLLAKNKELQALVDRYESER